jgi:hypothetical protein
MNKLIHFDIHSFNTEKSRAFDWTSSSYAGTEDFVKLATPTENCLVRSQVIYYEKIEHTAS